MLQHTEAEIKTLGQFDLIEGRFYLIQHNREGTNALDPLNSQMSQAQINNYNTRFRGRFVRYDSGKSIEHPNGIIGLSSVRQVAVFEDVEIVSKNKQSLTDDVYILSIHPENGTIRGKSWVAFMINDGNRRTATSAVEIFLQEIRNNNKVAFAIDSWTFAESSKELENKMVEKLLVHMGYDNPNPNDSDREQNLTKLKGKIFSEIGMASTIGDAIGPSADILKPKRANKNEISNTLSGNKRKLEEVGGRRRTRRTRRSRRNKRSKTRKGRTMKHRRHYRK